MEFQTIKRQTRIILAIGTVLVTYGIFARWFQLYFFWDSRAIGWFVLTIGVISYLLDNFELYENQDKSTIGFTIGIVFLSFLLIAVVIAGIAYRFNSDAYAAAANYISNNNDLKQELGTINGFGIMTTGSISVEGESGDAVLQFTAKGDKKFRDLTVHLIKSSDDPKWKVDEIEK